MIDIVAPPSVLACPHPTVSSLSLLFFLNELLFSVTQPGKGNKRTHGGKKGEKRRGKKSAQPCLQKHPISEALAR